MQISFIEPKMGSPYGSIRRVAELSNALIRSGHAVRVFSDDGFQPQWIACNAQVYKMERAMEYEADVVMFNKSVAGHKQMVDAVAAKTGAVKVYYLLGWAETEFTKLEELIKGKPEGGLAVVRAVFDDPEYLILACSSWLGQHLRERYRPDAVTLLGGVNRAHFYCGWPISDRGYKPSEGGWMVLTSGDPRPRKDYAMVVAAVKLVKAKGYQLTLATYWGKQPIMQQSEMGLWYSRGMAFLDAQKWAGWNNPVLEAMACGNAVVCTDIKGVQDFAKHEETALLVPVGDVQVMADALQRLCDDEPLRQRLATNALAGTTKFDWDFTAGVFLGSVSKHRAGRSCVQVGDMGTG